MSGANQDLKFSQLTIKTIVVHTVTYFVMGVFALVVFDYAALNAQPDMAGLMRQTTDPLVMAGPLFQPLRGFVFALVIYPLRPVVFTKQHGWLVLWWILVGLGIVATFGPAPGSIEGMIYTVVPIRHQLNGLLEVVPQALLLALGVVYWVNHPEKRWFTWLMGTAFAAVILLSIAGLLARSRGV
jgi:hypothetical protein